MATFRGCYENTLGKGNENAPWEKPSRRLIRRSELCVCVCVCVRVCACVCVRGETFVYQSLCFLIACLVLASYPGLLRNVRKRKNDRKLAGRREKEVGRMKENERI